MCQKWRVRNIEDAFKLRSSERSLGNPWKLKFATTNVTLWVVALCLGIKKRVKHGTHKSQKGNIHRYDLIFWSTFFHSNLVINPITAETETVRRHIGARTIHWYLATVRISSRIFVSLASSNKLCRDATNHIKRKKKTFAKVGFVTASEKEEKSFELNFNNNNNKSSRKNLLINFKKVYFTSISFQRKNRGNPSIYSRYLLE